SVVLRDDDVEITLLNCATIIMITMTNCDKIFHPIITHATDYSAL
ncbi:1005_t:CDS:1, partial [Racocetra fulgida]